MIKYEEFLATPRDNEHRGISPLITPDIPPERVEEISDIVNAAFCRSWSYNPELTERYLLGISNPGPNNPHLGHYLINNENGSTYAEYAHATVCAALNTIESQNLGPNKLAMLLGWVSNHLSEYPPRGSDIAHNPQISAETKHQTYDTFSDYQNWDQICKSDVQCIAHTIIEKYNNISDHPIKNTTQLPNKELLIDKLTKIISIQLLAAFQGKEAGRTHPKQLLPSFFESILCQDDVYSKRLLIAYIKSMSNIHKNGDLNDSELYLTDALLHRLHQEKILTKDMHDSDDRDTWTKALRALVNKCSKWDNNIYQLTGLEYADGIFRNENILREFLDEQIDKLIFPQEPREWGQVRTYLNGYEPLLDFMIEQQLAKIEQSPRNIVAVGGANGITAAINARRIEMSYAKHSQTIIQLSVHSVDIESPQDIHGMAHFRYERDTNGAFVLDADGNKVIKLEDPETIRSLNKLVKHHIHNILNDQPPPNCPKGEVVFLRGILPIFDNRDSPLLNIAHAINNTMTLYGAEKGFILQISGGSTHRSQIITDIIIRRDPKTNTTQVLSIEIRPPNRENNSKPSPIYIFVDNDENDDEIKVHEDRENIFFVPRKANGTHFLAAINHARRSQ